VVNFLCEIFCLEAGILGRSIALNWEENAIDEAFQMMDPAESRKLKRKFRKVARKMIPREKWNLMSRRQRRTVVMSRDVHESLARIDQDENITQNYPS